jgi:hypothetical protein
MLSTLDGGMPWFLRYKKPAFWKPERMADAASFFSVGFPWRKREKSISYARFSAFILD